MPVAGVSGIVSRAILANHSNYSRNGTVAGVHSSCNGINGTPSGIAGRDSLGMPAWQTDPRRNSSNNLSQDYNRCRQMSAHRRWLSRNKVGPTSGRSPRGSVVSNNTEQKKIKEEETRKGVDDITNVFGQFGRSGNGPKYQETLGASVLLYMGVGIIAIGMVITFVGIGDRAFHTFELQMIGPTLIGLGLFVCFIRVLVCAFANRCNLCDRLITDDERQRQDDDDEDESAIRRKFNAAYRTSIQSWRPISANQLNDANHIDGGGGGGGDRTRRTSSDIPPTSYLYPMTPLTNNSNGPNGQQQPLPPSPLPLTPVHFQRSNEQHNSSSPLPRISSESTSLPESLFSDSPISRQLSIESSDSCTTCSCFSEFQEIEIHNILNEVESEENDKTINARDINDCEDDDNDNRLVTNNDSETHHLHKGVVLNPSALIT